MKYLFKSWQWNIVDLLFLCIVRRIWRHHFYPSNVVSLFWLFVGCSSVHLLTYCWNDSYSAHNINNMLKIKDVSHLTSPFISFFLAWVRTSVYYYLRYLNLDDNLPFFHHLSTDILQKIHTHRHTRFCKIWVQKCLVRRGVFPKSK